MPPLRLSIIIPVVDEAPTLGACIANARSVADEVIVSDGGSSDGSPELAREAGARVVNGSAGRGAQLNRGAAAADCDVLLFLHADTVLPRDSRVQIEGALAAGFDGGGSKIRFDAAGALLRFGAGWINRRTALTKLPLGDQAQFITRTAFESLGGFKDWPILEDLDLMRRLKRSYRVAILDGPVVTSPRRFVKNGMLRTIAVNWLIWGLYLLGVSPPRLAALYRRHR